MTREPTGTDLLAELEPTVERNLNRHLTAAQDWQPHEYIPWDEGRNYPLLGGTPWREEQSALSAEAKAALVVNLLTEDNLPSYHREISVRFGRDGAWGQWVGRWTAEENRHGIALRDYLVVTRGVDPEALEQARMAHMTSGYDSGERSSLATLAYVTLQELATRVSHRNTGKATNDPVAEQLLARVAKDENLHMIFYRNLISAALEIAPVQTLEAIHTEVRAFQMPGADMPGFRRNAALIARAGIYDLPLHHTEVLAPTLRSWKVFERDLPPEGEKHREALAETMTELAAQAGRYTENRERRRAAEAARTQ